MNSMSSAQIGLVTATGHKTHRIRLYLNCHHLCRFSSTLHAVAISALAAYLILWTDAFSDKTSALEVLYLIKAGSVLSDNRQQS